MFVLIPAAISIIFGLAAYLLSRFAVGLSTRVSLACSAAAFLGAAAVIRSFVRIPGF
jgi:hypothetical protein